MGGQEMMLTPDTNVLVRVIVRDEPRQARAAERTLREASGIAVPLPCLCELAWVLRSGYRLSREEVGEVIRKLLNTAKVETNRAAVEAGLAMLEAGGDFADGVIAYEGMWLGAEDFVSFDRQAVTLLRQQGVAATQL
jgi:predicted nucleic-acid-binding protein